MFQFVHVNSYSRTLSKKAMHAKWTAKDVIAEATRDPSAIPHIDTPEPPRHIYGEPIDTVLQSLDDWADATVDAKGRKTRKDAVCLLAGVFSAPAGTPIEQWEKIKKDSISWAESKYGDRLKTVIEHVDEAHPHCHFYVIPRPGENFESIHEGRAAVKDFVDKGGDKRKTNALYRDVMRVFQDEYYNSVGAVNGMTRIGPGNRRLTRQAWKLEQQQANAIAEQRRVAERILEDSKANSEMLWNEAKSKSEEILTNSFEEAEGILSQANISASTKLAESQALVEQRISQANIDAEIIEKNAKHRGFNDGLRNFNNQSLLGKISASSAGFKKKFEKLTRFVESLQAKYDEQVKKIGLLLKKISSLESKLEAQKDYRDIKANISNLESENKKLVLKLSKFDQIESERGVFKSRLEDAQDEILSLKKMVKELTPEPEKPKRKFSNRDDIEFSV